MVERWGPRIVGGDGTLDRGAVADIVFSDSDELRALNGIVHPAVSAEMTRRREALAATDAIVILEIPLLVESGHEGLHGVVVVDVDEEKRLSVSESLDEDGADRGPVNALSKALVKDLGKYSSLLDDMRLVDFKVRITQGGTEATTRVIIDSEDGQGRRWSTVGVSANILDASFEALLDAIRWKLIRDRAQ